MASVPHAPWVLHSLFLERISAMSAHLVGHKVLREGQRLNLHQTYQPLPKQTSCKQCDRGQYILRREDKVHQLSGRILAAIQGIRHMLGVQSRLSYAHY